MSDLTVAPAVGVVVSPNGGSVTTDTFTVAPGDLLVACVASYNTISGVSDTLSGTWVKGTSGASNYVAVYASHIATVGTLSVTADSSPGGISMQVYKVTGASASPFGAKGTAADVSINNLTISAFVSTVPNSVMFVASEDESLNGAPTSDDLSYVLTVESNENDLFGFKALGGIGPQTANLNGAGTTDAAWYWVAVEIVPDVQAGISVGQDLDLRWSIEPSTGGGDTGYIPKVAGAPYGFDGGAFRAAIRFVFNMAMPSPALEQLSFGWIPAVSSTGAMDSTRVPFDPMVQAQRGVAAIARRPYLVEYIDAAGQPTRFGVVVPSRVRVWLIDTDYNDVKTCDYVTIDGETYIRDLEPPSIALFDVGLHQILFKAENER